LFFSISEQDITALVLHKRDIYVSILQLRTSNQIVPTLDAIEKDFTVNLFSVVGTFSKQIESCEKKQKLMLILCFLFGRETAAAERKIFFSILILCTLCSDS
jgi:hypothetical protein